MGVNLQWCTGKCANREWNCYKEFVRHNRVSLISERPRKVTNRRHLHTIQAFFMTIVRLCALDYFSESLLLSDR